MLLAAGDQPWRGLYTRQNTGRLYQDAVSAPNLPHPTLRISLTSFGDPVAWTVGPPPASLPLKARASGCLPGVVELAPGAWESSGIVDASEVYGPGTWLVNIQAHTLFVDQEWRTVTDTTRNPPVTGQVLFKREAGQLLLLVVPGS